MRFLKDRFPVYVSMGSERNGDKLRYEKESSMTAIEPLTKTGTSTGPPVFSQLKVWIINKTMASIVWNAVRNVSHHELRLVAPVQAGPAYYPINMLAMMTYCYALGILGAQEIEAMMSDDAEFIKLCRNEYPTWKMIIRFRRYNRAALEQCLSATFRAAWGYPSQPDASGTANRIALNKSGCRNIRLEDERGVDSDWFGGEARNRIEKAMWIDQMAMDDDE